MLGAGDVLVVAGKGHETGQLVGDKVLPFSDHDEVRKAWGGCVMSQALWTWDDLRDRRHGRGGRRAGRAHHRLLASTRGRCSRARCLSLCAMCATAMISCLQAFGKGAAAALVSTDYKRVEGDGALLRVRETLEGLRGIAAAARRRTNAPIVAVTGSVGKTGTKEALRNCLSRLGPTHAAEKSFNNHWGVPLTLARMPAGVATACSRSA